jgi:hypothetical protein
MRKKTWNKRYKSELVQQQRETHGNERNFSARGGSKEENWALNPKFSKPEQPHESFVFFLYTARCP